MAALHTLYRIFVDSRRGWLLVIFIDLVLLGGSVVASAVVRKAAYQSFSGGADLAVGFFFGLMLAAGFNSLIYFGALDYQSWKDRRSAESS